jgi:hypothetical protein
VFGAWQDKFLKTLVCGVGARVDRCRPFSEMTGARCDDAYD